MNRQLPLAIAILSLVVLAFGVGYVTYPLLHPHPEPVVVESASAQARVDSSDGETAAPA